MSTLSSQRRRYLGGRITLRRYLRTKAKLGIFDKRMCRAFSVDPNVNRPLRKAICRAYVAGLVPTSTTGGKHAPGSWHGRRNRAGQGKAVDFGLRPEDLGTREGQAKLEKFHRQEFWRAKNGKINPVELIGPINNKVILRGQDVTLGEGAPLETLHDNHVHEAYDA